MNNPIEKILSTLVIRVSEHFGFDVQEALAAVAQSKTADELSKHGNDANLSIDQICMKLFNEIANGQ